MTAAVLGWVVAALSVWYVVRYRRRYKAVRAELVASRGEVEGPITRVQPSEFDPVFAENEFGVRPAAEAVIIGAGSARYASTSDTEAWILSVLAKRAQAIFEFGTATGRTTYLLARNSPPDTRVITLTLPSSGHGEYQPGQDDSAGARKAALLESKYERFLYNGTTVESKIEQLFGDSKKFDEQAYAGCFDLIFIDGSHAYSYVKSDTEKALTMLRPGGVIVWHDYRGANDPHTADVYRYLNELRSERRLVHFRGTSLVAYRHS